MRHEDIATMPFEDMQHCFGHLLKEEDVDRLFDEEDDDYDSDSSSASIQSLPEKKNLENVVLSRYQRYHPKDLIPSAEKLLVLHLTEFNEVFSDLEEAFQEKEYALTASNEEVQFKKKKKPKDREKMKKNKTQLAENRHLFLKQKAALEKFYAFVCIKTIESHPMPSPQLISILNLLKISSGTLQTVCLHLDQFAYIDSDLGESDDEDDSDDDNENLSSDDDE